MAYQPGDIVALKSGSCAMTVFQIDKSTDGDVVTAAWMFNGDVRVMKFPKASLVYNGETGIAQDVPSSLAVLAG